MIAGLRAAWSSRSPRERVAMALVAAWAAAILYAWLLHSAGTGRDRLHASLPTLRAQAARLNAQAIEYLRLQAVQAPPASRTDLRTLLQAAAGEARIAAAIVSMDAIDSNQVKVVFGALPFADWLAWVAALRSQQVRIDQCRIEALSTPGLVSISVTFARNLP